MEDIANIQKYCKLSQYQLHIDSRLLNANIHHKLYEPNANTYTINFNPILKNVVSIKVLDSYMPTVDSTNKYVFLRCNDYFETSRKNMITSYSYLEKLLIHDNPQTYYYDDDLEYKLPKNIVNLNIRFEDYSGNIMTTMPDYHSYTLLLKYYKEPEHDYNNLATPLTYTEDHFETEDDFETDDEYSSDEYSI